MNGVCTYSIVTNDLLGIGERILFYFVNETRYPLSIALLECETRIRPKKLYGFLSFLNDEKPILCLGYNA